jgi:tRNA (guanine-N7-)-methyltransferase
MQPAPLEIDPFAVEPPLVWLDLFGNDHPVELEIGCGKGMFLREAARGCPECNYLGVERAGKYYRRAVERLARAGVTNVRLLRADGLDVLDRWIPPAAVRVIHILFPDPWPKKRHHKRRVFRPALMALAHRALAPGGELRVATDHPEYGEAIRCLLAEHAHLFTPLPWSAEEYERLPTNYALKWQRLGRPLWWARYGVGAKDARTPEAGAKGGEPHRGRGQGRGA